MLGENTNSKISAQTIIPFEEVMDVIMSAIEYLDEMRHATSPNAPKVNEVDDDHLVAGVTNIFNRYDLDGTGKIDSDLEFQQLTINILVKLAIPTNSQEEVQRRIDEATESEPVEFTLDSYLQWFRVTFLGTAAGGDTHMPIVPECVSEQATTLLTKVTNPMQSP